MRKHNPLIKGISYYRPQSVLDNEFFIEHFDKKGEDIRGLLESTGRRTRYVSENLNETMLTMGVKAVHDVLKKTSIKPSELNLIVFSSGTPEYISPSNALKLHDAIRAGQRAAVYDINANCVGMIVALEQVCRAMRDNTNIKYALVVGSDQLNRYARFNDAIAYSNFADSACAIVLENVSNTDRGFLESDFYTNSSNHDKIVLPAKGMSSVIHDKNISIHDKLMEWIPFNFDGAFYSAKISIEDILWKNNLTKQNIKRYFVSQFAKKSVEQICNELEEEIDKFTFIGDEFGYTGTTSPFLAYHRSVENNELNIGDYAIFWSVGAGTTCCCVLYRY